MYAERILGLTIQKVKQNFFFFWRSGCRNSSGWNEIENIVSKNITNDRFRFFICIINSGVIQELFSDCVTLSDRIIFISKPGKPEIISTVIVRLVSWAALGMIFERFIERWIKKGEGYYSKWNQHSPFIPLGIMVWFLKWYFLIFRPSKSIKFDVFCLKYISACYLLEDFSDFLLTIPADAPQNLF